MKNPGDDNPLGRAVAFEDRYNPGLLFRVPRDRYREGKTAGAEGHDLWNCYELSWLDAATAPKVAVARIVVPASSRYIVESKSLKLYLGSFSNSTYRSLEEVEKVISGDLSVLLEETVKATLLPPREWESLRISPNQGRCLDELPVRCAVFERDPRLLGILEGDASENVYSNLLRTLCPVTGQPDWATVEIDYEGRKIDDEGLLKYLVSFRNSTGFHEHCCETIFLDIMEQCVPRALAVRCSFTRRGGVDISPVRMTPGFPELEPYQRRPRQ